MNKFSFEVHSVIVAILLAFGSYIMGNGIVLLTISGLSVAGISVSTRPALRLLLSTVLLQGITFGLLGYLYLKVRNLELSFFSFSLPNLRDLTVTLIGIIGLLALMTGFSLITEYFGYDIAQNQIIAVGEQNPLVLLLLIPLSFLVVGPGEELLFRGIVQGALREAFDPIQTVVLASALFASIHFFSLSGEGKFLYIGLVFVLALILGGTYELTQNLTVPALIHGAYNAIQFASLYLVTTS